MAIARRACCRRFAGQAGSTAPTRAFLLVPGPAARGRIAGLYSYLMNLDTPIWMFLIPSFIMGIGNAGMWGPLATTATRNLPLRQAGAGAGIYNTTRTIGSVLGSAAIAVFMQSRLEANIPGRRGAAAASAAAALPPQIAELLRPPWRRRSCCRPRSCWSASSRCFPAPPHHHDDVGLEGRRAPTWARSGREPRVPFGAWCLERRVTFGRRVSFGASSVVWGVERAWRAGDPGMS